MVEPTISTHEILLIIHIIGTVLGVGGATMSDLIFFRATRDNVIQRHEWDILQTVSRVIWVGLIVAVLSGIGFLLQMDDISNPKIWAKVTIIGVILLNGVFLHWKIFPLFKSMVSKNMLKVWIYEPYDNGVYQRSNFYHIVVYCPYTGSVARTQQHACLLANNRRIRPYSRCCNRRGKCCWENAYK